jgi:CheY-like chemotaxis protein
MDHMMPDMDGIEAVRVIRNEIGSAYAREIPIIALTANAVIGSKELFISQGFNEFVSKPIDIFKLDEVIRKWIWHRHGEQTPEIPCEFVDRRKRPDRRKGGGDRRVIQRRSETKPNAVNGLDWAKGVERFGGEDAFRRVLLSFAVNTKPLLEQISKVGEDALAAYAITVHGIKSSGRGVGADALGALAESLELEAKNGNFGFIARHNADFLEMAHRIIAEIETLPDETGQSEAKPKKSRPGAPELRRLYAACADYDMNAIEAAMQEIESCAYTDDDGLVGWLRDNIARLNYAQITEKIAQAVNTNPN